MPIATADLDLIQAACAGDTAAIEGVLLRYEPDITRFARKYCPTPEDVEDAVQETLWIASQKIGTLRVAAAVVTWLFQVVKNECYRKVNGFAPDYLTLDQILEYYVPGSDSDREALLHQDVIEALARLPASYREVLILRDIEGMTAPETADQLGLTLETVKSRLHRARKLMRESLIQWQE